MLLVLPNDMTQTPRLAAGQFPPVGAWVGPACRAGGCQSCASESITESISRRRVGAAPGGVYPALTSTGQLGPGPATSTLDCPPARRQQSRLRSALSRAALRGTRYAQHTADGSCPRPFGIKSVTPRPDALTVRIAAEFLPDIISDIAPVWRAEEEKDGEIINMSGIPGLRALHRRGRTVLTRPGIPGRIVIPVPADRWRKAVMVAAELWQ
jgi:hypothetical protein